MNAPLFNETYIDTITTGRTPLEAGLAVQRAFMDKIASGELILANESQIGERVGRKCESPNETTYVHHVMLTHDRRGYRRITKDHFDWMVARGARIIEQPHP